MKPTLDEEIRRIAKKAYTDAYDADGFIAPHEIIESAIRAGIEAWKRQELGQFKAWDHFVYQMCPRHIAYPWPSFTTTATYVPPPRAICPICEPPMSASLRTSETTGEGE